MSVPVDVIAADPMSRHPSHVIIPVAEAERRLGFNADELDELGRALYGVERLTRTLDGVCEECVKLPRELVAGEN